MLIRNHLVNMQQYDLHLAQVWKELSGKRDSGSWEACLLSVLSFLHCAFCCCQSMENGLNYMAVAFAMQLVKILLVDERSVAHVTEADLFHTIETLMRINAHSRGNAPEG